MSPLRIPRPERAEGTVLAALLALLLALMVAAQFVLPAERPDPPAVPPARLGAAPLSPSAASADPVLSGRSIFRPTRLAASSSAPGASLGPLDGASPAGVVKVRGAARLILQTPDGSAVTLRPGQSWQGWRLIAIGTDSVRFARGSETVTLAIGAPAATGISYPSYDPRADRPYQADEQ